MPDDDGDLQPGVAWPDPRFTDHGDGTVTDELTHLMWTQNADLYYTLTWTQAQGVCAACTQGGYDDWRLPSLGELYSLVDFGRFNPALPAGHPFSRVVSTLYWSSTTFTNVTSFAFMVNLASGDMSYTSKTLAHRVWCARGGPY